MKGAYRVGSERYRAGRRLWSKKDDAIMRRRYPHEPNAVLAAALRRTTFAINARADILGLHKSAAYLASPAACRLRRGDNVGAAFRFKKGQVPANKGLRRPGWHAGRMKETQFKKGESRNKMPLGSTRLIDGYVYRKVSEVSHVPYTVNWKPEHHLLWIAANGPIPPHHALKFQNEDRLDIRLDNLELIARRDLMTRNSVHNLPAPLPQLIQLLGAVKAQITRKTRKAHASQEQDRRSA